jgi:hypothetical protein
MNVYNRDACAIYSGWIKDDDFFECRGEKLHQAPTVYHNEAKNLSIVMP